MMSMLKPITAAVLILGVLMAGVAEPQYGPSAVPEGALVRLQGTTQVYVIQGGRKCYIPDYETFQSRGYQWPQVVEVDRVTLDRIATGVPIPSVRQKFQYTPPGQSPDGQAGGMPARGPVPAPSMPGAPADPGAGSFPGGIGGNRPTFGKSPLNIPTPNPGMPAQQTPGSMQPGIGAPPPMLPTPMPGTPPQ